MKATNLVQRLNATDSKTDKEAWDNCVRGDLMLKAAYELGVSDLVLLAINVKCARLASHVIKNRKCLTALDVAEKCAAGEASDKELKSACDDALTACKGSASEIGLWAKFAKGEINEKEVMAAARAASTPRRIASYAAAYINPVYIPAVIGYVAQAIAANGSSENYNEALSKCLSQCADICREAIPFEKLLEL